MDHYSTRQPAFDGYEEERERDLAVTRTWHDGDRPITEQGAQEAADDLGALRRNIQNELNQQGEDDD